MDPTSLYFRVVYLRYIYHLPIYIYIYFTCLGDVADLKKEKKKFNPPKTTFIFLPQCVRPPAPPPPEVCRSFRPSLSLMPPFFHLRYSIPPFINLKPITLSLFCPHHRKAIFFGLLFVVDLGFSCD